jgi:archaellum component FlaC
MAEPIEPLDTSEVQNSLNELSSALQNFMSGTDTAGMMGIDRINEFVGSITSQLGSVPNELKTQANRLKNSLDNIISSVSVSSQTDALARLSNVISRVSDDLASESMGLSEAKNVTTGVIASLKQLQTDFQGNSDLLERALQSVTNRLNKNGTELQTLGEQLAAARSSGMAEEATRLQGQIENITQLNSTLQGIGAEIGTRLEIASEQLIKSAAVLSAAQ